jgi:hypothetical protein
MSGAQSRPVAVSLRLYRELARAFPHEFKCAYRDELLLVTARKSLRVDPVEALRQE